MSDAPERIWAMAAYIGEYLCDPPVSPTDHLYLTEYIRADKHSADLEAVREWCIKKAEDVAYDGNLYGDVATAASVADEIRALDPSQITGTTPYVPKADLDAAQEEIAALRGENFDLSYRVSFLAHACAWVSDEARHAKRSLMEEVCQEAIDKHHSTPFFDEAALAKTGGK